MGSEDVAGDPGFCVLVCPVILFTYTFPPTTTSLTSVYGASEIKYRKLQRMLG